MYCNKLSLSILSVFLEVEYHCLTVQSFEMILSIPSKAPPAINKIFACLPQQIFGPCLRPPFGGTQRFLLTVLIMLVAPFTRNITSYRRIVAYVQFYLVNKYDAAFCFGHIIVSSL
jgi:hypothetical protein